MSKQWLWLWQWQWQWSVYGQAMAMAMTIAMVLAKAQAMAMIMAYNMKHLAQAYNSDLEKKSGWPPSTKIRGTATFLPVFVTVDLQHLSQKACIEGRANPRLRFRPFS